MITMGLDGMKSSVTVCEATPSVLAPGAVPAGRWVAVMVKLHETGGEAVPSGRVNGGT